MERQHKKSSSLVSFRHESLVPYHIYSEYSHVMVYYEMGHDFVSRGLLEPLPVLFSHRHVYRS